MRLQDLLKSSCNKPGIFCLKPSPFIRRRIYLPAGVGVIVIQKCFFLKRLFSSKVQMPLYSVQYSDMRLARQTCPPPPQCLVASHTTTPVTNLSPVLLMQVNLLKCLGISSPVSTTQVIPVISQWLLNLLLSTFKETILKKPCYKYTFLANGIHCVYCIINFPNCTFYIFITSVNDTGDQSKASNMQLRELLKTFEKTIVQQSRSRKNLINNKLFCQKTCGIVQ